MDRGAVIAWAAWEVDLASLNQTLQLYIGYSLDQVFYLLEPTAQAGVA
jgi:hypothetical protein